MPCLLFMLLFLLLSVLNEIPQMSRLEFDRSYKLLLTLRCLSSVLVEWWYRVKSIGYLPSVGKLGAYEAWVDIIECYYWDDIGIFRKRRGIVYEAALARLRR
ncbi:uncharacterized protein F4812DRAFT_408363 [Daldinia caldariorum]|uniref:uncharacterized protein n=1 Tax=Daldinia caldariorum TaxID=326644 RepID=UPI00200852FA|nr:uncharacterized protein F4812DRAFT_408363 [Daldinia caldariorum]KAI1472313.1 hypothetical protein F4812DRAFT_408363 [Daldinia caldariorum]